MEPRACALRRARYPVRPLSFDPRHSLTVADELHGIALQDFLERQWPDVDRKALRLLVDDGSVVVNRMKTARKKRLKSGDLVEVDVPQAGLHRVKTAAKKGPIPVLYADAQLVIVDKPAGLPTVPTRDGTERGVHGRLQEVRPGADLRIVHRLDRMTSGCLALADGIEAARFLDIAFREGKVQKEYLALVHGNVARDAFTITKALGPDLRRPGLVKAVASDSRGAREAISDVEIVERFGSYTLVLVRPRTGRSHQIRVHLAFAHHPIVADDDYGGGSGLKLSELKSDYKSRRGVAEKPLLARMFLHAKQLTLPTPVTGAPVTATAELPHELQLVLDKVRRFGRHED